MGQYWLVVNLDKKEYVHPHKLGAGLKLWEQLAASPGTGAALIILCAAMPESRGGGDFATADSEDASYEAVASRTIGRWAGDRVALVGDYAKDEDLAAEHHAKTLYNRCNAVDAEGNAITSEFTDVSDDVAKVIEHELGGKFVGEGWREFKRE